MENSVRVMKHQRQGNANKLVTPEMRQQILQVKHQLDEYDGRLSNLFDLLNEIREALNIAQASAGCLLTNDPFEAWEKITKREFDALWGTSSKEKSGAKRTYQGQGNVEKLITPEMRRQIIEAKRQLDNYASCLREFFDDVSELSTFERALDLGEDMLCAEHLETWDARKKRQEEAAAAAAAEDEDLFDEF